MLHFTHIRTFNTIALVFLLTASGATYAKGDKKKDTMSSIDSYTCKDITSSSPQDRSTALAFLHGYRLGVSGKQQFNAEKLGKASDKFVIYCLENPKDKVAAAMDKVVKKMKK